MRTVNVTGTYLGSDGDPLSTKLKFTPTSALKNPADGSVVLADPVWAMTNGKGYFEIQLLPRQEGLIPNRFLYYVQEYVAGQLVKGWYMRLDEHTPDNVTMPALYPPLTPPPADIDIYPTLEDVRTIAADLDRPIYTQLASTTALAIKTSDETAKKVSLTEVGVTIAGLVDGKIMPDQMPAIRFQNTWLAESDEQMTALFADIGDVCVRPDLGRSKVLVTSDPTVVDNWRNVTSDFSVSSVNGQTGDVVLTPSWIGAADRDHGHDVLAGYDYVATYMRAAVMNTLQWIEVSDGGDQVRIDNRGISWIDASGVTMYRVDPYNPTPWSDFAITVLSSGMVPAPAGVTVTAYARQVSSDEVQFHATIQHWQNGWAFSINNATELTGTYTGLFGTWQAIIQDGTIIGAGVATVDAVSRIQLTGLPKLITDSGQVQANLTIRVRGTFDSAYVNTTDLLPDPNNEYRLQIGTVEQGELDAEISGNWPVQTLNLTLPDTSGGGATLLSLQTGDPVPDGTNPGTVIVRYDPGTGEVPATVTVFAG